MQSFPNLGRLSPLVFTRHIVIAYMDSFRVTIPYCESTIEDARVYSGIDWGATPGP